MDVLTMLKSAITPIVAECHPGSYAGNAAEYIVTNCTELPIFFGDDEPQAMKYLVQVHWFFPPHMNYRAKKKQLCKAISNAGFAYPTMIPVATDANKSHITFETEACDGDL